MTSTGLRREIFVTMIEALANLAKISRTGIKDGLQSLNLLSSYGGHTFQHASFSPFILDDHHDLSHFGFTNNTISVLYPSFKNFVSILFFFLLITSIFCLFVSFLSYMYNCLTCNSKRLC